MAKSEEIPIFYLTDDVKKQFKDTRDMLDQILETFEIFEDQELMKKIQNAEKEFESGDITPLEDLRREIE